ncbi:type I restriction enzyme, S subunit [Methylomarinovum caldicuralii]|uniref:Type I restriction enzyme, S subunit n=2 Tax=Methylomarinovum caldicuralii TaxID=438856 RepID=A0AAU9C6Y5_9GAMM|nr:type I restriction enzyme, S subunit [Methylomarinovum caldicuralii]
MLEKKKPAVPRLRFPEFRDAGPWEVRTIEDLSERIAQGGTPKTSVSAYWNGEIPWITPAEMGNDAEHHHTEKTARSISAEGLRNSSTELLPVNSVIISSRAPIGYVTINTVEMATNQGCKGIVPKNGVSHEFLYFSLLRANARLNVLGAGAGFKEISAATLRSFEVPTPTFTEQQKLADCLGSLDDLTRAEEARLGALKDHKRGLMQRLFPREGETTPRLRFPEFRNAGPWEVRTIEDLSERIAQGGTPKTSVSAYWNGEIPWITPAEMGNDAEHYHTEKTARSISAEGLRNSSTELLPVNSVIISSRAPIGYVTINTVEMATNQGCKGIVPKNGVSHEFLYFSLLRANARLNDLGAGAGFKEISAATLRSFEVPTPTFTEQQKIADCLTSLDDLIRAQAEKIEALKQHKKGLMQQLFPQEVG